MGKVLIATMGVIVGALCGWQARSLFQESVRPASVRPASVRPLSVRPAVVRPVEPFTFNDKLNDAQAPYLYAAGTWRGGDLGGQVNAVRIECDGAKKTCEIHHAYIMSIREGEFLSLDDKAFSVTQMDAETLTAEAAPDICIRQTLLIDRKAKTVSVVRTKTDHKDGCETVPAEPVTYALVDPLAEPGHKLGPGAAE